MLTYDKDAEIDPDFFEVTKFTVPEILGFTPEVMESIVKQGKALPDCAFKIVNNIIEAEVEVVGGNKIKILSIKYLT